MNKRSAVKIQYSKSVKKLEDVLNQKSDLFIRDCGLLRFKFCFDLSWKLIKEVLQEEYGVTCASPKKCIREAYKQEILDYDEFWLEMSDLRNKTAHTYNEELAEEIYLLLPKTLEKFRELEIKIK